METHLLNTILDAHKNKKNHDFVQWVSIPGLTSRPFSLQGIWNFVLVILKYLSRSLSSKWFGIITSRTVYTTVPKQASASESKITWPCFVWSAHSKAQIIYYIHKKTHSDDFCCSKLPLSLCYLLPVYQESLVTIVLLDGNVLCDFPILCMRSIHNFGW